MNYPKINTIWKRDESNQHNIIEGDLSCPEFDNIKLWHATEKIHGTNIRVIYDIKTPSANEHDWISFRGKTDDAMIAPSLLSYLQKTFPLEKFKRLFFLVRDMVQKFRKEEVDIVMILDLSFLMYGLMVGG